MFSSSLYPGTLNGPIGPLSSCSYYSSFCGGNGGNSWSSVNLKASSSILGRYWLRSLLLSSRHGFVFISISHGMRFLSIKKSYPKISKQYLRLFLLILSLTEAIVVSIIGSIVSFSILWKSTSSPSCSFKYLEDYSKDNILPSANAP